MNARRVLLTRPAEGDDALGRLLAELGFEVIRAPSIRIAPPLDPTPLVQEAARLQAFDWVVVTSSHGARALLRAAGMLPSRDALPRACAVGPVTAAELTRAGWPVELVPARHGAEEVVAALAARGVRGARVLFVRGDLARNVVPNGLRTLGAKVTEVEGYRTLPAPLGIVHGEPVAAALRAGRFDAVVLTSGSTARGLRAALGPGAPEILLGGALVACIGPSTAAIAAELGWTVTIVANQATGAALAQALAAHFAAAPRQPC